MKPADGVDEQSPKHRRQAQRHLPDHHEEREEVVSAHAGHNGHGQSVVGRRVEGVEQPQWHDEAQDERNAGRPDSGRHEEPTAGDHESSNHDEAEGRLASVEVQSTTTKPVGSQTADELHRHEHEDGPIGQVRPALEEGHDKRGEPAVGQGPDGIEFEQLPEGRM